MAPSQTTVEQLKQPLAGAQAQVAQLQLQNTALETMITLKTNMHLKFMAELMR